MFEVLKGHTGSCQRRTCLKWEINGELSANDRSNLMKLLYQVDKKAHPPNRSRQERRPL